MNNLRSVQLLTTGIYKEMTLESKRIIRLCSPGNHITPYIVSVFESDTYYFTVRSDKTDYLMSVEVFDHDGNRLDHEVFGSTKGGIGFAALHKEAVDWIHSYRTTELVSS